MYNLLKPAGKLILYIALVVFAAPNAQANIYAIDLTKVNYPATLQPQIDFLTGNVSLYNHWSAQWAAQLPKATVVDNLKGLYNELDKISAKTLETDLLLGDVASFLYNLDEEPYYQIAIDQYRGAQKIAPEDYRCYWFLANHYALSANEMLSIQTYQIAIKYLPAKPNFAFWNDYAVACKTAGMLSTARYAAHQASLLTGEKSFMENDITLFGKNAMRPTPADTVMKAKDLWAVFGKKERDLLIGSYLMGFKMAVDSNWLLDVGGLQNKTTYMTIKPQDLPGKNSQNIGYSMLVLAKFADAGKTLRQFADDFTGRYSDRKAVTFTVGDIKNCFAYEIKDNTVYPQWGGARIYAIFIERDRPDYPGMALETPMEIPKSNDGKLGYYTLPAKLNRPEGKIYYLIMLDSCAYIQDASMAVFKDFLEHKMVIE